MPFRLSNTTPVSGEGHVTPVSCEGHMIPVSGEGHVIPVSGDEYHVTFHYCAIIIDNSSSRALS